MMDANRTVLTYRYERWRAISSGIIETAGNTFLLLIAVRWFEADKWSKALVAGGGSFGLMLGPWIVARVETAGWPVAKAASRMAAMGAAGFLIMTLVPVLPVFVIGAVLTMAASTSALPLMTQIYQENYPERERGRFFSRTFMIRIATALVFSAIGGFTLSENPAELHWVLIHILRLPTEFAEKLRGDIHFFPFLLATFAGAFALASYCIAHVPSRALRASGGTHPFRALRFVRDDPLFRRTLVMWMLMGFANLMIIPLRVEYLANPKHGMTWGGLPLTTAKIAFLVGVIPNLARLVMSPVWGWLFDRMNFFVLRIVLNTGFALGMLSFFGGSHIAWLITGAIIYGISNAGGDVAWSLWVTKFAPPERVADYMSVHTFFTGLRGVIAPVVAFQLVAHWSVSAISWLGAGLIVVATLLLIPEIKSGEGARRASALTEEVSE